MNMKANLRRRVQALEGHTPQKMPRQLFTDYCTTRGIDLAQLRVEDPDLRGRRAEFFFDFFFKRLGHTWADLALIGNGSQCKTHGAACPYSEGPE
jgi:hypothetical protein